MTERSGACAPSKAQSTHPQVRRGDRGAQGRLEVAPNQRGPGARRDGQRLGARGRGLGRRGLLGVDVGHQVVARVQVPEQERLARGVAANGEGLRACLCVAYGFGWLINGRAGTYPHYDPNSPSASTYRGRTPCPPPRRQTPAWCWAPAGGSGRRWRPPGCRPRTRPGRCGAWPLYCERRSEHHMGFFDSSDKLEGRGQAEAEAAKRSEHAHRGHGAPWRASTIVLRSPCMPALSILTALTIDDEGSLPLVMGTCWCSSSSRSEAKPPTAGRRVGADDAVDGAGRLVGLHRRVKKPQPNDLWVAVRGGVCGYVCVGVVQPVRLELFVDSRPQEFIRNDLADGRIVCRRLLKNPVASEADPPCWKASWAADLTDRPALLAFGGRFIHPLQIKCGI